MAVLSAGRTSVCPWEVTGEKVRIGILAPGDVKVLRKELVQTIEENQQAVRSDIGPGAVRSLLGGRGTV